MIDTACLYCINRIFSLISWLTFSCMTFLLTVHWSVWREKTSCWPMTSVVIKKNHHACCTHSSCHVEIYKVRASSNNTDLHLNSEVNIYGPAPNMWYMHVFWTLQFLTCLRCVTSQYLLEPSEWENILWSKLCKLIYECCKLQPPQSSDHPITTTQIRLISYMIRHNHAYKIIRIIMRIIQVLLQSEH
jgi:hypothetical protein